jgi:hypothetical protein
LLKIIAVPVCACCSLPMLSTQRLDDGHEQATIDNYALSPRFYFAVAAINIDPWQSATHRKDIDISAELVAPT